MVCLEGDVTKVSWKTKENLFTIGILERIYDEARIDVASAVIRYKWKELKDLHLALSFITIK